MYILGIYSADSERSGHASVKNAYGDSGMERNALQMRYHCMQHVTGAYMVGVEQASHLEKRELYVPTAGVLRGSKNTYLSLFFFANKGA